MTVSAATSRNDYSGNGILTTFPYTFRIFADADLNVYVAGVLKTLTTHFTVTGAGATGGGNVVFVAAPTGAVAIVRNVAATQAVDLVENDPFSAETVEAALDRPIMVSQQLQEITGRALAVATSSTQKNLVVDDLVAGKFLQVKTPATAGLQMVDITATGSIGIPVSIAQGGTGAITATAARTALLSPVGVTSAEGSHGGAYTTTTTSAYANIDNTNLKITKTVPVGWTALIEFNCWGNITAGLGLVGIAVDGTVVREMKLGPAVDNTIIVRHVFAGDGSSHVFSAQFTTSTGGTFTIHNGFASEAPVLTALLTPTNP